MTSNVIIPNITMAISQVVLWLLCFNQVAPSEMVILPDQNEVQHKTKQKLFVVPNKQIELAIGRLDFSFIIYTIFSVFSRRLVAPNWSYKQMQ